MKRALLCLIFALAAILPASAGNLELKTVVIDAGHGGKDPGAVSKDKKTYEKTFTLDIATRLAAKIKAAYPGVKVVLTRSRDEFVSLNDRAVRANKAGADLFISVHINASPGTSPHGYSVHVLGQSGNKNRDLFEYNMDVCRRENSVILLEDDYSAKYQGFDPDDPESYIFMQLMQNAYLEQSLQFAQIACDCLQGGPIKSNKGIGQNPFYVLWKTAMPAVLVELGFISNDTDLAALKSESNRDALAARLCTAFGKYKEAYDSSLGEVTGTPEAKAQTPSAPQTQAPEVKTPAPQTKTPAPQTKTPAPQTKTATAASVRYGTQVFALGKDIPDGDSRLLGYKPVRIKSGNLVKYIIGVSSSVEEARREYTAIRKKYPEAYTVKISGGSVERYKL